MLFLEELNFAGIHGLSTNIEAPFEAQFTDIRFFFQGVLSILEVFSCFNVL